VPSVTSADVARESGVSRTTVSYVLNDTTGVTISAATRARVRDTAQRLGYTPSAAARTLRTGRSDLVLCVLPDWPRGPAIDTLLDHLAGELAGRGLILLVHHGRASRPLSELWRAVTPRAVVGLTAFNPQEREAMQRAGIQVLGSMLDEDVPGGGDSSSGAFSVCQARVGRLQVRHLVGAGHRVIGYAAPTDRRVTDFVEPRLAGVRSECVALGLPEPVLQPVGQEVASAAEAVRGWRASTPRVEAVAAYNDEVAIAVLAGMRAEALSAPDDLAVIGVDDIPFARLTVPALTTVSQSLEAQAHHLGAAVLADLDGRTGRLEPLGEVLDVVVRESA
jgi:DNA-binding LacI/PurR family transcriptional regulator